MSAEWALPGRPCNDGHLQTSTNNSEIDLNMPVTQEAVGSSPISVAIKPVK